MNGSGWSATPGSLSEQICACSPTPAVSSSLSEQICACSPTPAVSGSLSEQGVIPPGRGA
jgi:hypothetical protein